MVCGVDYQNLQLHEIKFSKSPNELKWNCHMSSGRQIVCDGDGHNIKCKEMCLSIFFFQVWIMHKVQGYSSRKCCRRLFRPCLRIEDSWNDEKKGDVENIVLLLLDGWILQTNDSDVSYDCYWYYLIYEGNKTSRKVHICFRVWIKSHRIIRKFIDVFLSLYLHLRAKKLLRIENHFFNIMNNYITSISLIVRSRIGDEGFWFWSDIFLTYRK